MKTGVARTVAIIAACVAALAVAACNKKSGGDAQKGPRPTPITAAQAVLRPVELREESVGYIESRNAPTVSAEVAGRVAQVMVDNGDTVNEGETLALLDDADLKLRLSSMRADAARLETLTANQQKNIERLRSLLEQKVVSQSQVDDAEAQLSAIKEQLTGARAQLSGAERDLGKSRIMAPVSGKVQNRMVSVGDYLAVGKPLFVVSNEEKFQIHLPFPETAAHRIKAGQPVRLSTPVDPGREHDGVVAEIKPTITAGSRAIDAIVYKHNPGGWKSGASVNGSVLVGKHHNAVVVPALSVVLRPAGEVVYVVEGGKAAQRIVRTGARQDGMVEIVDGVREGETLAADGAGFLTDGAPVKIQEKRQQ
ncbi:MAG: efflux RND transporter periplasmic adaptor subunit [Nitrospinae bacterium]|nr:efflux RND transporter periplasmic adaptor subunit [Nitrospinota bacterium]